MFKNILAGIGVVLLVALVVVASPALGKPHHAKFNPYARVDIWHPDSRSIA